MNALVFELDAVPLALPAAQVDQIHASEYEHEDLGPALGLSPTGAGTSLRIGDLAWRLGRTTCELQAFDPAEVHPVPPLLRGLAPLLQGFVIRGDEPPRLLLDVRGLVPAEEP